ncbi:MAG: hypothetical protein DI528_20145 [Shinella sp.]|nr:MAG: hypothetical protein DI528_20145 [Shinella sp.]
MVDERSRLIALAMLHGVETNPNVSQAGVMLYGDEGQINLLLHHYDGRDVPARPYDPDQIGDVGEET